MPIHRTRKVGLTETEQKTGLIANTCIPMTIITSFNCNRAMKMRMEAADSALQQVEAGPIVI